jgi:hypothetical protein
MRRPALWAVLVLSAVVVIGVWVQVYLIASYFFGADALDAHKNVGGIVHIIEVLVFLVGIAAWWKNWVMVGTGFALAVIGTLQLSFADGDDWVGGLHGLFALIVLTIAVHLALRAWRDLQAGVATA